MFFRTSVFLVVAAACAVAQNVFPSDFSGASAGSFAGSSADASSMDSVQGQRVVGQPVGSIGAAPYAASPLASFAGDGVDSFSAQKTHTPTSVQQANPVSRILSGAQVSPVPSRIEFPGVSHVSVGNPFMTLGSSLLSTISSLPALLLAFPSIATIPQVIPSSPFPQGIHPVQIQKQMGPSFAYVATPPPQFVSAPAAPELTKTVKTTVTEIERSKDNLQTVPGQAMSRGNVVPVTSGVYRPAVSTMYRPVIPGSYGVSPSNSGVGGAATTRAASASTASTSATASSSSTSFSSSSSQAGSSAV